MAETRVYLSADIRALAGVSRTTFDYYLRIGLIVPEERSEAGYLVFGERQKERLLRIVALRGQGKSIRAIRKLLDEEDDR